MRGKEDGRTNVGSIIAIIILLCIIGFLIWLFGFSGNNNNNVVGTNTNQTNQPTAAEKKNAIRDNWTTFFNGSTPTARKVSLLENGQQFKQAIQARDQSKTAKATTATVSNVNLGGNGKAAVTYTININGKPALKNQTGQAVLINGVWKVSDTAFCNLLQLSGNVPPNCPAPSGGSQQTQPQSNGSQSQTNTQPQTPSGTTNQ